MLERYKVGDVFSVDGIRYKVTRIVKFKGDGDEIQLEQLETVNFT